MNFINTDIPEVFIIEPTLHQDQRGYFAETYRQNVYQKKLRVNFVQDNLSASTQHVLRGLHYQLEKPQAKLVYVIQGSVLDVAVDIRKNSPTFGQSVVVELTEQNHRQLFVPAGFAHGFVVLSEIVIFTYKCSEYYNIEDEYGIIWNDPDLNIDWRVTSPILSDKDQRLVKLSEIPTNLLPSYQS